MRYRETVADPIGTAEKLMAALGSPLTAADREAMRQTVADNERDARPRHRYAAADFGLTPAGIARDFADYHARYIDGREPA